MHFVIFSFLLISPCRSQSSTCLSPLGNHTHLNPLALTSTKRPLFLFRGLVKPHEILGIIKELKTFKSPCIDEK